LVPEAFLDALFSYCRNWRVAMTATLRGVALAIGLAIVMPVSLVGHHGSASFDNTKEITLKGTVTEWLWANPHCFLKMDAKDESGELRNWNLEFGNPTDMTARGFRRNTFKVGEEITVTVTPVKSGAPVGRARVVTKADGQKL
jgi:Family of unknown function (DUF6152)